MKRRFAALSLLAILLCSSGCNRELAIAVIKETLKYGIDDYDRRFDGKNYIKTSFLRSDSVGLDKLGKSFDFDSQSSIRLAPAKCNSLLNSEPEAQLVSTRLRAGISSYEYNFISYFSENTNGNVDVTSPNLPIKVGIQASDAYSKVIGMRVSLADVKGLNAPAEYLDAMSTCCRIFAGCGRNVLTDAVLMNATVRAVELSDSTLDAGLENMLKSSGIVGVAKIMYAENRGKELGSTSQEITHYAYSALPLMQNSDLNPKDIGMVISPSTVTCNKGPEEKLATFSLSFSHPEPRYLGYKISVNPATSLVSEDGLSCTSVDCPLSTSIRLRVPSCQAIKKNPAEKTIPVTANVFFSYKNVPAPSQAIADNITVLPEEVQPLQIPTTISAHLKEKGKVYTGDVIVPMTFGGLEEAVVAVTVAADSRDVSLNAFTTSAGVKLIFTARAAFIQDKESPALVPLIFFVVGQKPGSNEKIVVDQRVDAELTFATQTETAE
ncbi:MAG: hypothetical protein ACAI44_00060 [Candidatus Sericytochromatia bacterium]